MNFPPVLFYFFGIIYRNDIEKKKKCMSVQEELKERLLSYLRGELEEKERQEVIRWINESAEHRRVYLEIRRQYYFMRWYFREDALNVEPVREKLWKKWRKPRSLWKRYVAVAASWS